MKGGEIVNNQLTFDFSGWFTGLSEVLSAWTSSLEDIASEYGVPLVEGLASLVVVVGIWYGLRAVLRAMRATR